MPLLPTGFSIAEMYHDDMETTITLNWDTPQDFVVDNYTLSISPAPQYQPENNLVSLPPWNVTVSHNQVYTVNITAMNCLGSSGTAFLSTNINISK